MRAVPKRLVILASSTAFLAGCGSTGVIPVGNARASAKPEGCRIAVFEDQKDVGRSFEKLCLISAKTGSTLYNDRSPKGAMKKVNAAACGCGADAVILQGMDKKGVSLASWGSSSVSALAIRYTGPEPAVPSEGAGARLVSPSGEPFGTLLAVEAQHRFPDRTVGEGFLVSLASGGEMWLTGDQGRKMLASPPAPTPAPKE